MFRTPVGRKIGAVLLLLAVSWSSTALAQYVWLDEKGVKQFSDRPPPATVQKNRILKEPGSARSNAAIADQPAADGRTADAKASDKPAVPGYAERNADFNKRRQEQAAKDAKAEEQQRSASTRAKNCERAEGYRRNLESGGRIARTDKNGERVFLTDEQREQELSEATRMVNDCKRS